MRLTMLYRVMLLIIAGLVMGALVAPISQATAQPQPEVQFYASGVGRVRLEPDYAIVVFAVQAISKTAAIGSRPRASTSAPAMGDSWW